MKITIIPNLSNDSINLKSNTHIRRISESGTLDEIITLTRLPSVTATTYFNNSLGESNILLSGNVNNELLFWDGAQFERHWVLRLLNGTTAASLEFSDVSYHNSKYFIVGMAPDHTWNGNNYSVQIGLWELDESIDQAPYFQDIKVLTDAVAPYSKHRSCIFMHTPGIPDRSYMLISMADSMAAYSNTILLSSSSAGGNLNKFSVDTNYPGIWDFAVYLNKTFTHASSDNTKIASLSYDGLSGIIASIDGLVITKTSINFNGFGYKVHYLCPYTTVLGHTYIACTATPTADTNIDNMKLLIFEVDTATDAVTLLSDDIKIDHHLTTTPPLGDLTRVAVEVKRFNDGVVVAVVSILDAPAGITNNSTVFTYILDDISNTDSLFRLTGSYDYNTPGIPALADLNATARISQSLPNPAHY